MGDIGGGMQAGASVIDTAAQDATNIYLQQQAQQFNAGQAALQRQWSAGQQVQQEDFNASQAALNRNFQAGQQIQAEDYNTQMSNTQVQRRADDIKAAGFNPLLAVGQLGGASAPQMSAPSGSTASAGIAGGATASSPAPAQVQGFLQNAAQLRIASAQAANINQNTKLQASQKDQVDYQNTMLAMDTTPQVLVARQQAMMAKYGLDYATASEVDAAVQSIRNGVKSQNLDIALKEFSTQLASMDVTAQKATLNSLIEMRNAVNAQQTQEAKNVLWVQSIPFLSKTIATAQAVLTPVSSAAGAAQGAAGAAKSLYGIGGALVP